MSESHTAPASTDRIERHVMLETTPSRVWRALTDVQQFNRWFGVALTSPFVAGAEVAGQITIRNYEHLLMTIWIESMEPETFFSFRWHPHAIEQGVDYSAEATTLVAFSIEPVADGTKLTIVESGFDALPAERRSTAFTGNGSGWSAQLENIRKFLAS